MQLSHEPPHKRKGTGPPVTLKNISGEKKQQQQEQSLGRGGAGGEGEKIKTARGKTGRANG